MKHQDDSKLIIILGMIFFLYSLLAGVVIQTILVPVIFPHINLGDGLIVLDSNGFNQIAKQKALEIIEKGWVAWELRPQGQTPAGIASLFYALITPKPYSMLPFNALLHAFSGCLVFWLLRNFFSVKAAVAGSLIFILNPSAMEWVAQIHRDGLFILGNLMVLAAFLLFSADSNYLRKHLIGIFFAISGAFLVWAARPFWAQVIFVSTLVWLAMYSMSQFLNKAGHNEA